MKGHLIVIISLEQENFENGQSKFSKLMVADLAGFSKSQKNESSKDLKLVNSSLSSLGKVIDALSSNPLGFIPYRNSKLTRILQDGFGGNSKTILLIHISDQPEHVS